VSDKVWRYRKGSNAHRKRKERLGAEFIYKKRGNSIQLKQIIKTGQMEGEEKYKVKGELHPRCQVARPERHLTTSKESSCRAT